MRREGLGLNQRHLPVKRLASDKTTNRRGRGKAAAGFCIELERYRRLAYGPALGTRSMTRWRDTSETVAQHPNIPNIHYKHRQTPAPAPTDTNTTAHTQVPINTHTNVHTQVPTNTHTNVHTQVSTKTHTNVDTQVPPNKHKKTPADKRTDTPAPKNVKTNALPQKSTYINTRSNNQRAPEKSKKTKHTPHTRAREKRTPQAQDTNTHKTTKRTPHARQAHTRSQNAHAPQTQEKPENQETPINTEKPKRTEKERFEEMYVKGELIGHGGYGDVYAGFRRSDSQPVALKFVNQKKIKMWAKMSETEDALPLEIALLRQVCCSPRCKGVAQLLDYYCLPESEGEILYLMVLERPIPCLDLFSYMQDGKGYLDEGMARHMMQQVVFALLHCHSRGVVHRDLKPENILVQLTSHKVLLLDFGSASVLREGAYYDVAGTPEYFPPETVLRGEYFAVPATVWSLGILLFQMVWGDVPFYSDASIVKATLYFPRGISRDCRHLIRRCLAVSPDDRPTLEQIQEHPWMQ